MRRTFTLQLYDRISGHTHWCEMCQDTSPECFEHDCMDYDSVDMCIRCMGEYLPAQPMP